MDQHDDTIFDGYNFRSALMEAKAASRLQDSKFRVLFEEMKEAFMVLRAVRGEDGAITDLRLVEANAAAANFFARPKEDIIGKLCSELMGPTNPTSIAYYYRVIDCGERISFEHYLPNADRWASIIVFRPSPEQLAVLATDITKIKRSELHLKSANERLEYEVRERTLALREALNREVRLNELKSSFLTMTSHELATPLASIRVSLDVIEKYDGWGHRKDRERYLGYIRTETDNLLCMLRLFRVETPIDEYEGLNGEVTTNLSTFLTELGHEMELLTTVSQKIRIKCTEKKPVIVDAGILRRIVINLLFNSIKYSREDIDLRCELEEDQLTIMVRDRGIGIPQEEQHRLFTDRFRASNTGGISGTGLGLTIVKTYLELMGGRIEFESAADKGTTFWITVPVKF